MMLFQTGEMYLLESNPEFPKNACLENISYAFGYLRLFLGFCNESLGGRYFLRYLSMMIHPMVV